jgi:hypothetical protein
MDTSHLPPRNLWLRDDDRDGRNSRTRNSFLTSEAHAANDVMCLCASRAATPTPVIDFLLCRD